MRSAEGKELYLVSLGCPKNQVDSEVLTGLLLKEGFLLSDEPEGADLIVVNTCAFIQEAVREAIDTILEMIQRKDPRALLVVAGCLPQRYKHEVARELPEVDLWIGPGDIPRLPQLLREGKRGVFVTEPEGFLYDHRSPRILFNTPYVAYLKIAEGCPNRCSFCTIPRIRGRLRSRPLEDILEEARMLSERGVKELVLVAQDTTSYGRDLGMRNGLLQLLEGLLRLEGFSWLRVLYCYPHPGNFPEELLRLMASESRITPYLDLPIQHVSDKVLKAMNRKTRKAHILSLLEKLSNYPRISLRGTVIVGFPGEEEADFRELLDLISQGTFHYLGAFKFSPEEGTPAASFPCQVPEEIKEERFHEVMKVQQEISLKKNQSLIGQEIEVLVETLDDSGRAIGRASFQAPEIDGLCTIRERISPGAIIRARVIEAGPYDLTVSFGGTGAEGGTRTPTGLTPPGS